MVRRIVLVVAVVLGVLGVAAPAFAVDPPFTGAAQIDAGGAHTCALMPSQTVRCWGLDTDGQVGNGPTGGTSLPTTVQSSFGTLHDVLQIAAGSVHTCARVADRHVWCWGDNQYGQLGDGDNNDQNYGVEVRNPAHNGALGSVIQITSGYLHSCALLANHQVRCWGVNSSRQLGNPAAPTTPQDIPVVVRNAADTGPLTHVTQIVAAGFHTCALIDDGTARCWGENTIGELGGGITSPARARPLTVKAVTGNGPLRNVLALAGGASHTCARVQGNQVRCWGYNASHQLGLASASTGNRSRPVVVHTSQGATLTGVTQIQLGNLFSCARLASGGVDCWGDDTVGQRGDGPASSVTGARPVRLPAASKYDAGGPGNLAHALQVTGGGQHACARVRIENATRVQCWGENSDFQLGTGSGVDVFPRPRSALAEPDQSE